MRKGKILSWLIVSLITIPAIASAAQCTKPPISDSSCPSDSTFYDSLRFEHKYSLDDYFYARGGTNYIKGLSYEIKEQCDYNDSSVETENGFFYTTDDLRNRKWVLPARTEPYWIITSNDYEVRKLPPQRNMGNLLVKYNVTYNVDWGTNTTHTECGYYEITRCWDWVLDIAGPGDSWESEQCDPADTSHTWWGNGWCDKVSCTPINIWDPVCNSTYHGQRVTSLTEWNHLCTEWTYGSFKYDSTNHKRTWKCNNVLGASVDCWAIKPYCGDGIKDSWEQCDPEDTSHAWWWDGWCNAQCNPVKKAVCNSTYSGQRITNLTEWNHLCTEWTYGSFKYDSTNHKWTWKCNDELGVWVDCSAIKPYCGDEIVDEWEECDGSDDCSDECKKMYCGDWIKNNWEECDPADTSHAWWGPNGCNEFCEPEFDPDDSCSKTFKWTLRCGKSYTFPDSFIAGWTDRWMYKFVVNFEEGSDLNWWANPTFFWTDVLKNNNMLVKAWQTMQIIDSAPEYLVKNCPTKRSYENLYIEYIVTSAGEDPKWQTLPNAKLSTHKECVYYDVSRCGDGTLDTDEWEICDPADPSHEWWGDGWCDEDCKPVEKIWDLEIEKTLVGSKEVKEVWDIVTWKIKVTAVDWDVTNFIVTDKLPEVLEYDSYTVTHNPWLTVKTPTQDWNNIEWKVEWTLKKWEYLEIELKTKVKVMPEKDYKNVACVKKNPNDPEKCDDDILPVDGKLKIEKTLIWSKEVKEVWDLVSWSIKVTALEWSVTNFKVIDKMPPILWYSGYIVIHNPWLTVGTPIIDWDNVERNVVWTLNEWEYLEIQLTTYVKQMPDKEYKNVACVKENPDGPEICDDEPMRKPLLRIKKYILDWEQEVKEKTVKVWDEIVYKVKFWNKGTASATITSVKDFLPKNVEYVSSEIYINWESVHTNNPSWWEVINSNKKVDWVYIDIYGWITLEPGVEWYIIIKWKILNDNQDNRTNFACIYLNDKKPDDSVIDGDRCDDAVHNFDDWLLCSKPEITTKSFTSAWWSTTVTCKASWEKKADSIELDCGNWKTYTWSNISSLSGTCVYPQNSSSSSISYSVVCKVNGETADVCKDTVTVAGTTPPSSCFVAWTKVTMADGSQKNIEDIKIWEKILWQDGSVNTVLWYDRPLLWNRHLWSINGWEYFVSDEHPFMTTEWWKSFNPEMTKLEIDLNATELKVWDSLVTENGTVEIDTVDYIDAKDSTQLYNFVLDGNHTYYANNYLVHNKWGWGPSCDKITTDPDVTTSLASWKDIAVTCTATSSAYILIDCDYKDWNKYDENNKNFFVSTGRVTIFTGTCKNYTQNSKIQCLVKENSSDNWQSAKDSCWKNITIGWWSSCFVAWTKVTMADGSQKNIEDIKIWEKILWQDGSVNKVLWYDRPSLWNRHLWSINGWEYFVSDEHPFMTTEWWKSFNPEMTKLEVDLNTTKLKVWDSLVTENGTVKIDTVDYIDAEASTQLYNFVLDGNHTYYANNYLVHNKGWGSCFIAWTKVVMADWSEKNIEDVKIWEKIMWENWVNTVLWYDRPILRSRHLWSINGSEYFVSDEHPFKTTEWWKSFNPEMTKLEINLNTTELKVWDILVTKNGLEMVKTVDYIDADYNTQLYNFVLDWDHTYHANGYLVHNKWPDTSCFIAWTKVTMADWTKKNIEDVKIWEEIMWENWVNTVLWYDRPSLWSRHLWSINGWEYFVSDEHPFMTTEWWKSFNPEITKLEIDLNTTELKVWDILVTEKWFEKINTVDYIDADDGTQLYNFILNWDHTYYADGYLVHNKWWGTTPTPIYPTGECFDVNANQLSYEQWEILPFYWNISNLSKENIRYGSWSFQNKVSGKCKEDDEGLIALNSMVCEYKITDWNGNLVKKWEFPCLTEENFPVNGLLLDWMKKWKNLACDSLNTSCFWTFSTKDRDYALRSKLNYITDFWRKYADWMPINTFWEYKIWLSDISYLQCIDWVWTEKSQHDVCNSDFTLTNSYTVQKTPSGNFKASTEALINYLYYLKDDPKQYNAANLLKAITASEYKPNEAVNKAMEGFINKYSKLAVSVWDWLKKVPGKNIYFVNADIPCLWSQCPKSIDLSKPTTFVQTQWNTTIKWDLDSNLMLLTKWKIIFEDQKSCNHRQVVKWIFYSALPVNGIQRKPVQKNTADRLNEPNAKRCTEWWLTIKWVLIWNWLWDMMENSRSNLNNWFSTVNGGGKNAQTVMNWASVLIEYSPSVFTKGSMPPGAEDFTTALSIYKD